jgi:hypothetical protein
MAAHRRLVDLASYYDGRSCDVEGDSADSVTARNDNGATDIGGRMDHVGTFGDLQQCCTVQKCVFGKTPSACENLDFYCPSRWGRIDPRTCDEEAPKLDDAGHEVNDDAHREGYYRSQKDCCHSKVILDGCTPRSPDHKATRWEEVCCPYADDSSSTLDSGRPRGSEDYLTA